LIFLFELITGGTTNQQEVTADGGLQNSNVTTLTNNQVTTGLYTMLSSCKYRYVI